MNQKALIIIVSIITLAVIGGALVWLVGNPTYHNSSEVESASKCGDGVCDTHEQTTRACKTDCDSVPEVGQTGKLYITTVTHHDRGDRTDYPNQPLFFESQVSLLDELLDLYDEYGAVMTLETSLSFAEAAEKFNDDILFDMQTRGHGLGAHVDWGIDVNESQEVGYAVSNVSYDELVDLMIEQKKVIEQQSAYPLIHNSGTPSPFDWVQASIDAGFQCHTSIVTMYLVSLSEQYRPAGWDDLYILDGNYHQAYPLNIQDRIHPTHMLSGQNWNQDDPDGQLINIPGESGTHLGFYDEVYGQGITDHRELLRVGEFSEEDIDTFFDFLDQVLPYAEAGKINTMYVMLSMEDIRNGLIDHPGLMEQFLKRMDEYVEQGKVEWKSIPDMCELSLASST